jgi:hypothetical protein
MHNSVTGILWLVQTRENLDFGSFFLEAKTPLKRGTNSLDAQLNTEIGRWIPALGFSVGLDTLTTVMIAGRLIYHHRRHNKSGGAHSSSYLPLVTIFIESAALSLISKIIQISIPSVAVELNPFVIPLCVSSGLTIILFVYIKLHRPFPQISSFFGKHLVSVHSAIHPKTYHNSQQYNSRVDILDHHWEVHGVVLGHLLSKV